MAKPVLPGRQIVSIIVAEAALLVLALLAEFEWINFPGRTALIFGEEPARTESGSNRSEQNIIQFREHADAAGVTAPNVWGGIDRKRTILETKGNGVAFFDFDNDGWPDIYLTNGTRFEDFPAGREPTNHLYRNNGNGTFTDVTALSGLAGTGWQSGVCAGDYDNDGWTDLLLTYWGQNRLLHNHQGRTFTDVTQRSGLAQSGVRWNTGCNFLDFDHDGALDIFVANYVELDPQAVLKPGHNKLCTWKGMPVFCGPRGLPGGRNLLYHNNGDGTFVDVSKKSGIGLKEGKGIGSVSYDFDQDGWPDVYVANDSEPSFLYHNNQGKTFSEIGPIAGVAFSEDGLVQGGMGVAVGDYDGDGQFDIFKTNFLDQPPNLYHNDGKGVFRDLVYRAGLAERTDLVSWGTGLVDVDNDGWKDILFVNGHVYPEVDTFKLEVPFRQPRLLYRNLGNGRFQNISSEAGPVFKQSQSSRGCAFGDFNNDGRIDALIMNMNAAPSLWINESRSPNSSMLVKLAGTHTNRSAIGARVRVVAGMREQIDEVHSGDSVMSMSDLRLHFGLKDATKVDLLEVRWPRRGNVEQFRDLVADQIVEIREGAGIVRTQKLGGTHK